MKDPSKFSTLNDMMIDMGFAVADVKLDSADTGAIDEVDPFESASNRHLTFNETTNIKKGSRIDLNTLSGSNSNNGLLLPKEDDTDKQSRIKQWIAHSVEAATTFLAHTDSSSSLLGHTQHALQDQLKNRSFTNDKAMPDQNTQTVKSSVKESKTNEKKVTTTATIEEKHVERNKSPTSSKTTTPFTSSRRLSENDKYILDGWDPAQADFDSAKNIYGLDINKPEARVLGHGWLNFFLYCSDIVSVLIV